MTKKIRVAVAGLGFGAGVHVPGFRKLADVDVVAIAGRSGANATKTANSLGITTGVEGYEKLLEFNPDAVSIALPPKENALAAEFFLKRGIPVLCEKPIAGDVTSAMRLEKISREIPHAVCFQFAELPAFCTARSAIQSGRIGRVCHIQTTWLIESYANRNQTKTWKRESDGIGGVLSLFGAHAFYLLGWLISPIAKISARLTAGGKMWVPNTIIAPDTFQCWAELDSGPTASLIVSNASPGMHIHRWEIIGDVGTIIIENRSQDYMAEFKLVILDRQGEHLVSLASSVEHGDGRIPPFATLANRFISSVKKNKQSYPSFSEGLRVQFEIDAAIKSNSNQQIMSLSQYKKNL
jgi:predicted dehydrogenase